MGATTVTRVHQVTHIDVTAANTAAQGNDGRITGALQTSSLGTGVATALGNTAGAAGGFATYSALGSGAFASAYSLPAATSSVLGGVKPDGTTISNSSGAISINLNNANTYTATQTFPAASLTLSEHATQAANTIVGNGTGSSASPTALAVPSCSTASSALQWTSGTGFGCATISGGGGTLTAGTTATSGFTAGQLMMSDGSLLQVGTAVSATSLALNGATIGSNFLAVTGSTSLLASSASNIPLIIKGFASQTADLQDWNDSSSNNLLGIGIGNGPPGVSGGQVFIAAGNSSGSGIVFANSGTGAIGFYTGTYMNLSIGGDGATNVNYLNIGVGGAFRPGKVSPLNSDGAGLLAQRNSTTAQGFRSYNTYTDASNYERGVFDWTTNANVLTIGTQNLGTGTARNLKFVVGGASVLDYGVSVSGQFAFPETINAYATVNITNTTSLTGGAGQIYSQIYQGRFITNSNGYISWRSSTTSISGSDDTGISRISAGVIGFGNGTAADVTGTIKLAALLPGVIYSAAGTALPTCAVGLKGQQATVSDATAPTYRGAYTSGGAVVSPVYCDGSSWLTF